MMLSDNNNPGFKICGQKGFHITFDNGCPASVQFGCGNYCDNYDLNNLDGPVPKSATAEIAGFSGDKWYQFEDDSVSGHKSPQDVLKFLNIIAALPPEQKP